jgi:hypothetical protein
MGTGTSFLTEYRSQSPFLQGQLPERTDKIQDPFPEIIGQKWVQAPHSLQNIGASPLFVGSAPRADRLGNGPYI